MLVTKHRILLVDDHQLIIDGIKGMFVGDEHLDFSFEANDGLNALDLIKTHSNEIDLVITDVNMPTLSGIELCLEIKKHFPHIKVLVLSMYQNSTVVKEALQAEADGYIIKNTGKLDFSKAIHRILDGGTYFSEAILPLIYKEVQKENKKKEALSVLTEREIDVLKLIVKEMTSEEIAEKLFISKKTVDNHRQNLLHKTESKSTVGLVKFALNCGLEF
jgi:DNA-binding NarL/FixJ family response regulator